MDIFDSVHDFYAIVVFISFVLFILPCFSVPFEKWRELPLAIWLLVTVLFLPELCAFLIYRDDSFPWIGFLVDCLAFVLITFTSRNVKELHSEDGKDDVDFRFL